MITEQDIQEARYENQFALQGADPVFPTKQDTNMVVFLSFLEGSTNIRIRDLAGVYLSGQLQANDPVQFNPPVRVDGGVRLEGTVRFAHGFFIMKN